jgi:hypothetical protein
MTTGQSKPVALISRPTARDLSAKQYYAMKLDSSGDVDYADSSNGDIALGPLNNEPGAATGAEGSIAVLGTALMIVDGTAGGGISIGSKLGSNSAYEGVAVTADDGYYFAIALEASSADGDIIEVLLVGPSYISAATDN